MDGQRARIRHTFGWWVLASALSSCVPRVDVDDLPTAEAALESAGKRLSRSLSAGALTSLASRGDRVLAALNARERDALSRGYLRFRIDREADVFVAAPRASAPFWLDEVGFHEDGMSLNDTERAWSVYRKAYPAGWVGLGVNGLDRTPRVHYAVFVSARDGRPVALTGVDGARWEVIAASEKLSLESDTAGTIRDLPPALRGSTLVRTAHDRRHASMLAKGRVWKTHAVASPRPDQVTVSFGPDASRELVWSWRTSSEVRRSAVRLRKAGTVSAREVTGSSEVIATPDLLNDPVVRRHTARASDLEPATAYEYVLGDGSGWTPVRTARSGVPT